MRGPSIPSENAVKFAARCKGSGVYIHATSVDVWLQTSDLRLVSRQDAESIDELKAHVKQLTAIINEQNSR